jgi:hypothetical protein
MTEAAAPDALAELIERLGKASGPDRDIDLAINVALWPDGDIAKLTFNHPRGFSGQEGMAWDFWHSGSIVFEKRAADGTCPYNGGYPLPAYTGSVDAALTLRPEGAEWDATTIYGIARCTVGLNMDADGGPFYGEHKGGSVPIALCIAALMARAGR